jgi:hypothetical protein
MRRRKKKLEENANNNLQYPKWRVISCPTIPSTLISDGVMTTASWMPEPTATPLATVEGSSNRRRLFSCVTNNEDENNSDKSFNHMPGFDNMFDTFRYMIGANGNHNGDNT